MIKNIYKRSQFIYLIFFVSFICLFNAFTASSQVWADVVNNPILLSEDFEGGVLDSRITVETVGGFNSNPDIKDITNFGSTKAFGFGRSTCGMSCFGGYVTNLRITFPNPTYVSTISFKELELYDNWGSQGYVITDDGSPLCGEVGTCQDFGRSPINDRQADTTYRTHTFSIEKTVTVIELKVWDITNASEITIDDLFITGGSIIPTDGLVAYYPFNGNADDESGNGNNGIVYGAALTTDRFGNASSAYTFDGVDNYIEVTDSPSINPPQITVGTWANLDTIVPSGTNQFLVAKGHDGAQGSYYISQNGDQFQFYLGANGVDQIYVQTTPLSLQTNRWYYLTGVYDGSILKIYVDGVLKGETSASVWVGNSLPLTFGCQERTGANYYFAGKLDDIVIYNRALTDDEIALLYTGILPQAAPSISGFTPTSGPVGIEVDITGNNFTASPTVRFNGTVANVTSATDTLIKTAVPIGATTGPISVTTVGGTATSAMVFTVIMPAPVITGFTPTSGPVGIEVTITGSNFTTSPVVRFNGVTATIKSATDTLLKVTVPVGATTGRITVTNAGGTATSASDFTVTESQPPVITSFTPTSGPVGTEVSINGSHFTTLSAVKFNGIDANVINATDTLIIAVVPMAASTGPITVITAGGTTSSSMIFTVTEGWLEDFESYNSGSFPSPNWTYSGNSDINIDNTTHVSGNQSVRMFGIIGGCWGALLHRPMQVSPPFTIEFYVSNGSENTYGCHPSRGGLALNTGASWTTPGLALIVFDNDGMIRALPVGAGITGRPLSPYSTLTWTKVKIGYEEWDASTLKVSFWVNDQFMGTDFHPACFTIESSGCYQAQPNYLTLAVGEGTVWFDDIKVTPGVELPPLPPVSPSKAANSGQVTITLTSDGFTQQTQVTLMGAGLPTLTPLQLTFVSPTTLLADFDLTGVQTGVYDVRIETPGQAPIVLSSAFEITGGTVGRLQVALDAPPAVRNLRFYPWTINYGNDGGANLPASLFIVSNDVTADMALSPAGPFREGPLQVLGVNLDGPAGILPPGSSYKIPVFMKIPLYTKDLMPVLVTSVGLKVEKLVADSTPIDWASIETGMRPADMDQEAWNIIWSNFKAQVGSTWAQYLQALNNDATYISLYRSSARGTLVGDNLSIGKDFDTSTYDVRTLLQFEFARAAGALNPRSVLAAAQDVFFPEPGLPLIFGRFAPQSIENRFRLGSLGRGWAHTYEYSASTDTDGSIITVKGPGDAARNFYKQSDGSYIGMPGEYGTATLSGGAVTLREKDGVVWVFGTDGELASIIDPNSNSLTMSYTGGNLSAITHSNGEGITIAYDGNGRVSVVTDPAGQTVKYTYDAGGQQLASVEKPGGLIESYGYNAADGSASARALASISFPDGTHYYYSYDALGRLSEEHRDGGAERVSYTYDAPGTVNITDAQNHTAVIRYGPFGETLEIKDPLGSLTKNAFDSKSQINQITGPDGKAITLAYDGRGNPVGVMNSLNQLVRMSFESNRSRLTELVDARSAKSQFTYDGLGNLQTITYPDSSAESFAFDSSGNVASYTNRRHNSISYTRNAKGQITQKAYPDSRTIDYIYDENGNLISAADSLTGTITMQYDARNFLTRIEYPGGRGFTFQYNDAGLRTKRTSLDGEIINYLYDDAGRLHALTDGAGNQIISYEYDANGRLAKELKGNGTQTTYEYDAAGQLLHIVNYAPDATVQSRFDYTYDVNGNRTSMTTLSGVTVYAYDDIGQLVGVTYPDGHAVTYVYDAAGNRVSVTDDGVTTNYTTNNMNQYTQVGSTTYSYDNDGNMISKTDNDGTTTYEYDAENRLVKVVTPSQGTWEYIYDALGNRVAVNHGGTVTRYVHDPIGLVDVAAEYSNSGSLVARYTHGLGLVARTALSGGRAYYAFDGIGNTRQMTESSGVVANSYDYSPFGEPLQAVETVPNLFKFVGRPGVMDDGSGLQFMRARYYDQCLGRFYSGDPMGLNGGAANLYSYAGNNPARIIDPTGLKYLSGNITVDFGALGGVIGGVVFGPAVQVGVMISPMGIYVDIGLGISALPGLGLGGGIGAGGSITISPDDPSVGFFREGGGAVGRLGLIQGHREPLFTGGIEGVYHEVPVLSTPGAFYGEKIVFPIISWTLLSELIGSAKQLLSAAITNVVTPHDPNEKIATTGIGDQHYIARGDEITYQIYFENAPTATAPAQEVVIDDTLDSNLDWSTFRLGEIAFGKQVVSSLTGYENGGVRVPAGDMLVDIVATHASGSGQVRWTLRTIDPSTGDLPQDALAGFLPPEDGSGRGQGHVTFKIRTRSDCENGTQIANSASITFDVESPILTNTVVNTITDSAPGAPTAPSIADGASDVPISAVLAWSASQYATSYDIYFWTSGQQKTDSPTASGLISPFFDPPGDLDPLTTYRWQAVARNVMGATPGTEWSFTTATDAGPSQFTLSISKSGNGSGTVTSSENPPRIDCGSTCSVQYDGGSTVTLMATPAADSIFDGWSGDPDCYDSIVTMDGNRNCIAMFTVNTYTLIKLIVPNGGDVLPSGSTYTINWSASQEAVKFKLEYTKNNGQTWILIQDNLTGTSYNWTVPKPLRNKINCLVRVTGYDASDIPIAEDTSDATFTIEVVKLTSPDGGETFTSGNTYPITWSTNATKKPVAKVKLFYSINGGTSWTLIKKLSGNPGSYNWGVPSVSTTKTQCLVKVVLKNAKGKIVGVDKSDDYFTIQPSSVLLERTPFAGLYVQGSAPPPPTNMFDNVLLPLPALIDNNFNTATTINIGPGIGPPDANRYQNIGIQVSSSQSVDSLFIYVNQDVSSDTNLGNPANWQVFRSNSNAVGTWSSVSIVSVTISVFDTLNNIYRYEIRFSAPQSAVFFKAINLDTVNAPGVTNVFVTEIEAYGTD